MNRKFKTRFIPRRYIYHFFPSGFCKPNLYRFKLWLLPTLMGDTVGWAGNELLLWHLLCIGNGAAQQKGTRALPDHLCVPSKPESEAVKSGIAQEQNAEALLPDSEYQLVGDKLGKKADNTPMDGQH